MKKKLLVLLITVSSTTMPNLVQAIAIDDPHLCYEVEINTWICIQIYEKETISTTDCCYSHIDTELGICGGD